MKKQDLEFIDLPAGKAVRIKEPSYAFALIIKDLQNDGKFALVYPHALTDNGQPDLKFMELHVSIMEDRGHILRGMTLAQATEVMYTKFQDLYGKFED